MILEGVVSWRVILLHLYLYIYMGIFPFACLHITVYNSKVNIIGWIMIVFGSGT